MVGLWPVWTTEKTRSNLYPDGCRPKLILNISRRANKSQNLTQNPWICAAQSFADYYDLPSRPAGTFGVLFLKVLMPTLCVIVQRKRRMGKDRQRSGWPVRPRWIIEQRQDKGTQSWLWRDIGRSLCLTRIHLCQLSGSKCEKSRMIQHTHITNSINCQLPALRVSSPSLNDNSCIQPMRKWAVGSDHLCT